MRSALIIGANSDIAKALVYEFAKNKVAHLFLVSRDRENLERLQKDLFVRFNTKTDIFSFDVAELNFESAKKLYQSLSVKPDCLIYAAGYLGDQKVAQLDFDMAKQIINTNYTGAIPFFEIAAEDFEKRKTGCLVGISSVAGLRGRQSNYLYGSAKSGFTTYLSGLRNRLAKSQVHVVTVLPGFVDTKMIEGMELPKRLMTSPEELACRIMRAIEKKQNVIYSGLSWRIIMGIITALPEAIFKRLNF